MRTNLLLHHLVAQLQTQQQDLVDGGGTFRDVQEAAEKLPRPRASL